MSKSAIALLLVCVTATPIFGDGIPDAKGAILGRPDKLEWKGRPGFPPTRGKGRRTRR
jgi:hypothetical protein